MDFQHFLSISDSIPKNYPRITAAMGRSPSDNNRSESINRILKRQVKKCSLPNFIEQMHELATEQMNINARQNSISENGAVNHKLHCHRQESPHSQVAHNHLKVCPSIHILSQSYDRILTSANGVYDDSILKGMWTKAGC